MNKRVIKLVLTRFINLPGGFKYSSYFWDGHVASRCAKPFSKVINSENIFKDKIIDRINSELFQEFRQISVRNIVPGFYEKRQKDVVFYDV